MRRKWVILVALVFLGVVVWVVVTSPKVYSIDEVRATLSGGLDSGWIMESESVGFYGSSLNIFQMSVDGFFGISGPVATGGYVYELRNGVERASCLVYYEGSKVEGILLSDSMNSRDLMRQIQQNLPGIQCRIDSP